MILVEKLKVKEISYNSFRYSR